MSLPNLIVTFTTDRGEGDTLKENDPEKLDSKSAAGDDKSLNTQAEDPINRSDGDTKNNVLINLGAADAGQDSVELYPIPRTRCFVERSAWGRIVERLNCICCGVKNRSQADQESIQAITIVCSDDSILSALEAKLGSSEEHCLESESFQNESNIGNTGSDLVEPTSLSSPMRMKVTEWAAECSPFVFNNEELYYNAKQLKASNTADDLIDTLKKENNCSPSKALMSLSDGRDCITILKHQLGLSVSILELRDCSLSFMDLIEMLLLCENLTQVTISMADDKYEFYRYNTDSIVGVDDHTSLIRYRKTINQLLEDVQEKQIKPLRKSGTAMLYCLKLHLPNAKACSVALAIFNAVYGDSLRLEELEIRYSQRKMLQILKVMNADEIDDLVLQDSMTLDCIETLINSRRSFRKLSLSCEDQFPLDWLRDWSENDLNMSIFLKYQLTCGLVQSIVPLDGLDSLVFPKLEDLSMGLPLLRILGPGSSGNEGFRNLLLGVETFLSRHLNMLKHLTLNGIRTEKMMLPWIKSNFSGTQCSTGLGLIYYSSELKKQLHEYYDQIASLGIILDKNTFEGNINALINPKRDSKVQIFPSVHTLQIVNNLENLLCFSITALVDKFPRLSTLVIEDNAFKTNEMSKVGSGEESAGFQSSKAKVGNFDLKTIIQQLSGTLQVLHLDCNMSDVTDEGITGCPFAKSSWYSQTVKYQKEMFSFALLPGLQYLYLRGLGNGVTDQSANLCFSDTLQFTKLRELHLFAPMISEYGKQMIRKRFSSHRDFILELA